MSAYQNRVVSAPQDNPYSAELALTQGRVVEGMLVPLQRCRSFLDWFKCAVISDDQNPLDKTFGLEIEVSEL